MKRIVYKNLDGSISIVIPSGELPIEEVLKKDVPIECQKSAEIISTSEIPTDRTFRNAWEYDKKFTVHLGKAKEIHKNKLRELRKPLLENLDIEFIKAQEKGIDTKEIIYKKQLLRDITKKVDDCKNVEEILKVTI